jgi:S1-C subfamily serine protease
MKRMQQRAIFGAALVAAALWLCSSGSAFAQAAPEPDPEPQCKVGIGAVVGLVRTPENFEDVYRPQGDKISRNNSLMVFRVLPDSPALKATMHPDHADHPAMDMQVALGTFDTILEVDGVSLEGLTLDQAVDKIGNGPAGSRVVLTVLRDGRKADFTLLRDTICAPAPHSSP